VCFEGQSRPRLSHDRVSAYGPHLTDGARSACEPKAGNPRFSRKTDPPRCTKDNRAALLYDCELPQPVGKLRIASFFRVEKGKIRVYETLFDATELRQLQARQRAGQ
jgi:hypothetical protein